MNAKNRRRYMRSPYARRFAIGLLLLGVLLSVPASTLADAPVRNAPEQGALTERIVIRVDENYPPFSFRDGSGNMTGFTVELIAAVLNAVRVTYEVRASDWSNVVTDLTERRQMNMVAQMAYADSRAEHLDFSPSVGRFSFDALTLPGLHVDHLDDLRHHPLIVLRDGIMSDYLRLNGITNAILHAPDDITMMRWLAAGRGDAALTQKLSGLFIASQLGMDVRANDLNILPQSEHLVVAKGNDVLLNHLIEGLNILRSTGRLDALREQWFGVLLPAPERSFCRVRHIFLALAALMLSATFAACWLVHRTRRERNGVARRIERQLRDLLETLPIGAYEIDLDGHILLVNNTFLRITGYSIEESLGMHIWNFMEPGPTRDAMPSLLHRMAEEQQPLKPYFCHNRHKSGRPIPVQIDWTYRRNDEGQVLGFVCTLSDITERRRIEKQLMESEKMDAFGRIAGSVATEFQTQFDRIDGFAGQLQRDFSDPEVRACANGILTANRQAVDLVRHLQAFAHKNPMRHERLDIHSCLKAVAGTLNNVFPPDLHILLQPEAPHAIVIGDPAQIEQVFLNLGLNARDAIPGAGTLTFRTSESHSAIDGKAQICVDVVDTGCGIPRERLPHLFEPFYSTQETHERLGIGLATVYGIVRKHGGTITVKSTPGEGTTFTLCLPLAHDTPHDAPPESA